MNEAAFKLSQVSNVTGTLWAANFDDPDGHHLSIFGPEHK
jgi:predicted lactoylglutathione lyase